MKKLLSILIILSLLASFTACKRDTEDNPCEEPIPVNGVYVTEYKIVYDAEGVDYNKRAAEYIRDSIYAITGCKLEIVDDSEPKGEREIVVGETSRAISAELDEATEGFEFAMLAKDGTVALEAQYFVIAAAAYYFIDTYFNVSADVTIPDGVTVREPVAKEAKNIILLIGDGMGLYQTKLYEYLEDVSDYSDGEGFFYGYMFPYQGFSRTQSLSGITDSAAGGTALSTGYKTLNRYVGMDKDGNDLKSLTELSAELGKATAVMSTESQTGATPSTFSSHTLDRGYSDEIREDQALLSSTCGTLIECNFDYYTARYMKNSIEKRVTETLGKIGEDQDGFFVMYEEAHIDKHSHDNDIENTFLALIRFNQAIARFMEYAFYNPDTAVLITADHETGGLRPDEDGKLSYSTTNHTSDDVPIFAWGEGFESLDGATVENIDIAKTFAHLLGNDTFGDQGNEWYDAIYGNNAE